jgi:hypothetical protein
MLSLSLFQGTKIILNKHNIKTPPCPLQPVPIFDQKKYSFSTETNYRDASSCKSNIKQLRILTDVKHITRAPDTLPYI